MAAAVVSNGTVEFDADECEAEEEEEEEAFLASFRGCPSKCITTTAEKTADQGNRSAESTLRSRRRPSLLVTTPKELNIEDVTLPEVTISPTTTPTTGVTASFQVPETTASSSAALLLTEGKQREEEEALDFFQNDEMKRLNQACEAVCMDLIDDLEATLTNNNLDAKTLPSPLTTTSISDTEGENETDPLLKLTSSWARANHHLYISRASSLNKRNFVWSSLSRCASLAKDLLELLVFTLILFTLVYGAWLLTKLWYVRTTRNSQDAIYPVLRTMRVTSLAFLNKYPNAQELYEEACILHNPFYEMDDVSCWPCENVRHMLDFTGFSNFTSGYYQSGIPFIVKDALSQVIQFNDLYSLLKDDPSTNLTSTVHLLSNRPGIQTFDQLHKWTKRKPDGNPPLGGKMHVTWKVNRAQYARLLRTLFQRPYYIPQETEISVQHFLYIDEPHGESYPLPITEFANVFLMQGDGPRLVVLVPVRHCQQVCKPIRVLLEPRDVLYYNWLFWRPISSPVKAAGITNHSLSITYVGSFY